MRRAERPLRGSHGSRWLLLAGAFAVLYCLLQLARVASSRLSGPAGEILLRAAAEDRRTGAMFYTEVGPVGDYLRQNRGPDATLRRGAGPARRR